ncbi:uncharacterized protein (TIGR02118 family) [Labedella gwakjiensis]|uniref:EthD family reductase n=2 Tax=Labedella gwakjiensis TaxID=390269 RepID=A0A2P8GUR7_9MICO|nr:uncharacterized protein (TIGR02118 family) [Labedella gwakjiensis]RUQ87698.1 EthD family reductase [Labedella gwakjiensis]
MYRMTILYSPPADGDVAAFRRYYEATHIPVAQRMAGLTGWNLSWIDTPETPYILVAELYANSADAMSAILASPEGMAASADLDNFVTSPVHFLTGEEIEVRLS